MIPHRETQETPASLGQVASLVLAAAACSGEAGVEETTADRSGALGEPAQPGHPPTPTPTELALPWDRGVIAYTADDPRRIGDLVAQDPDTGEVHTLVDDDSIESGLVGRLITSAAWSVDGRWIAFETMTIRCSAKYADGTGGLWAGRRRASSVDEGMLPPDVFQALGTWAWSPAGTQLVLARSSIRGTSLLVIDPTTGERSTLVRRRVPSRLSHGRPTGRESRTRREGPSTWLEWAAGCTVRSRAPSDTCTGTADPDSHGRQTVRASRSWH